MLMGRTKPPIYGLLAEFDTPAGLVAAAERARKEGYRCMDAYAPFPVEGLAEALKFHHTRVPLLTLIGGIVGGLAGYFMQYWIAAINYPLNIGGRPLHSWPAFIPITFELTVLGAALTAFFGSLALSGLPKPYHPMFNLPEFERASQDRFFLCIEAADARFDMRETRAFLESLKPLMVAAVSK